MEQSSPLALNRSLAEIVQQILVEFSEETPLAVVREVKLKQLLKRKELKMAKEYAIGETFLHEEVKLKVEKGYCPDCYFLDKPGCHLYECHPGERVDGEGVMFVEEVINN